MSGHCAIYEGVVSHRRLEPFVHAFRYGVFMVYLDLDELPRIARETRSFAVEDPAFVTFRRMDHHGDPSVDLAEATRDLVAARTGHRPAGPVRLLTNLAVGGYCFNPVSFYYCYDDGALRTIVAEVHNTPWAETHCYVLDRDDCDDGDDRGWTFRFDKSFHVSPFWGMDHRYTWAFNPPGESLHVSMQNHVGQQQVFQATMRMKRHALDRRSLRRMLWRYPLNTARIIGAIYYHAARLWLKGATFHPHPRVRDLAGAENHD